MQREREWHVFKWRTVALVAAPPFVARAIVRRLVAVHHVPVEWVAVLALGARAVLKIVAARHALPAGRALAHVCRARVSQAASGGTLDR